MQECNVCVASASSSSELELAPRPPLGFAVLVLQPLRRRPAASAARRARGCEAPTRQGAGPSSPIVGHGSRAPRPMACTRHPRVGGAP
jgi:hypothetical protein